MKILKIRDVITPMRANPNDAGFDLFVPNDFKPITLLPGEDVLIPSGIKVNIPENRVLITMNKSGVATKKKLIIGACVIDEPYQGEIHIHLFNNGNHPVDINDGDKITQLVCLPVDYVTIEEVSSIEELYDGKVTTRGDGGFGSTGVK